MSRHAVPLGLRALAVWLVLISVEIVHGTLRTLWLAPHVGDVQSRQIGVFTGSILILVVAYLFARWLHADSTKSLLLIGLTWLALTVCFELGVGRLFRSWEDLMSDYDIFHGGLLPLGLIVLALSPWISARLRQRQG
jgi:hypothetical protein